jgi:hypothetical protein
MDCQLRTPRNSGVFDLLLSMYNIAMSPENSPEKAETGDYRKTLSLIKEKDELEQAGDFDNPRYKELEQIDGLELSNFYFAQGFPVVYEAGKQKDETPFNIMVLPDGGGIISRAPDYHPRYEVIDKAEVEKILNEKEQALKKELAKVQEARNSLGKE